MPEGGGWWYTTITSVTCHHVDIYLLCATLFVLMNITAVCLNDLHFSCTDVGYCAAHHTYTVP